MMFNHIHVNIDSVEFEYVTKGNLENISIARPDGVGYSQWSGAWNAFVEFLESRQPTLYDYVERQVDTSEIEALEDKIGELKDEIHDLHHDLEKGESEIEKLEEEIEELKEENRIWRRDLEAAEKANEKLEEEIDDIYKQQAYSE